MSSSPDNPPPTDERGKPEPRAGGVQPGGGKDADAKGEHKDASRRFEDFFGKA